MNDDLITVAILVGVLGAMVLVTIQFQIVRYRRQCQLTEHCPPPRRQEDRVKFETRRLDRPPPSSHPRPQGEEKSTSGCDVKTPPEGQS